jgi:hypothetical protein
MKLARKAIITIMTTLALLAGVSAAAATTASAATTAAPSLTPSVTWYYWSSYGTLHACDAEGEHLFTSEEILHYKCPRYNKGDYFVWELYVILGHPPGS